MLYRDDYTVVINCTTIGHEIPEYVANIKLPECRRLDVSKTSVSLLTSNEPKEKKKKW